jgi:hypothetical protein
VSIPMCWRLVGVTTGASLTDCMDIDGIFVDRVFPVQPRYERHTLLSCTPSGPLLAAIDGTGPAWFGNVVIDGAHVPGRPVNESCEPGCNGCYDTMEELLDVRVVGHRPAADGSGLLDIDLDGHRRDGDNNHGGTLAPAVFGYRVIVWSAVDGSDPGETPAGECRDIAGLFHDRPDSWPPGPPLTLLGCRPGLTGSFQAELAHLRVDGTVHTMSWGQRVFGTVVATRPSTLGGATPGFRMVWHHCDVARTHLVSGYDRKSWSPAVTFDDLVRYLTDDGVQLELR